MLSHYRHTGSFYRPNTTKGIQDGEQRRRGHRWSANSSARIGKVAVDYVGTTASHLQLFDLAHPSVLGESTPMAHSSGAKAHAPSSYVKSLIQTEDEGA